MIWLHPHPCWLYRQLTTSTQREESLRAREGKAAFVTVLSVMETIPDKGDKHPGFFQQSFYDTATEEGIRLGISL
jgi:hypothetical protein